MAADAGFHAGELAVQRRAGVRGEAARLARMLEPVELSGGIVRFLAERTFLVATARDRAGRLWISPLYGPPGFLAVRSDVELAVEAVFPPGDPLHDLPPDQKVGLTAVDFARRRRLRLNGHLIASSPRKGLVVEVEQAFGNCPQHISPRLVAAPEPADDVRESDALSPEAIALIRAADTFFLGTVHPDRGADASHRGGPPGFLGVDERGLWWPDYPGNNLFNSLGNLAVNPETALLVLDFRTGTTLHLSGTSRVEWGEAGRTVRFELEHAVERIVR